MDKLPSVQMTIIDKLPYDEQLNILRKLYGMPAVKQPVVEPRVVESVAVVVRKETELPLLKTPEYCLNDLYSAREDDNWRKSVLRI